MREKLTAYRFDWRGLEGRGPDKPDVQQIDYERNHPTVSPARGGALGP